MKHMPIDYTKWDLSGEGKNIMHLLKPGERNIWNVALEYQDKRNDVGHVEVVTYFALKLFEPLEAYRKIVIPTAILHDVGWSQMSEVELKLFGDKNWERYESVLRARHQEEGVKLANRLLEKTEYPQVHIPKILEIISQHDTRKGFLSAKDGVVRDADKLWRFTLPHLKKYHERRLMSIEDFAQLQIGNIDKQGFFYSSISKEIARIEIAHALEIVA